MALNFRWKFFGLKSRRIIKIRRELDALLARRDRRDGSEGTHEDDHEADPVLVAYLPGGRPHIYHFERAHRTARARNAAAPSPDYVAPALEDLGSAAARRRPTRVHTLNVASSARAGVTSEEEHEQERLPEDQPV